MLKIKDIDVPLALREMEFRFSDGRSESAVLKIGAPYEYGDGYDWCCAYKLEMPSKTRLFGMFGIDSLQALELTMKTIKVEVECWEKELGGKFFFLDEEGSGV